MNPAKSGGIIGMAAKRNQSGVTLFCLTSLRRLRPWDGPPEDGVVEPHGFVRECRDIGCLRRIHNAATSRKIAKRGKLGIFRRSRSLPRTTFETLVETGENRLVRRF